MNKELDLTMFKMALDKVNDAILMVSTDGDVIYANKQFCEEYGVEGDCRMQKMYDIVTTMRTPEAFQERVREMRENNGKFVYHAKFVSVHDNKEHVHQVSAFIVQDEDREMVWFFMKDISDLVKSRDELRELNYLFDAILSNIPVYLFVKDVDDDLRYLYWNKAFADYAKIPASKVVGNTDFEVFPDYADAQKFREDDLLCINNHEPINRHETYMAADGTLHIVQTLKTILPREGRGPLLIGVSWDITNMGTIEQELVRERMRVEEADRLKSAFLANMSHEIRTPLNAIVGFSNLLAETDEMEERQMYSDIIKQNADILLQLINDILDISKIEAGTLEYVRLPFDLSELFRSIKEIHKDRVQDGVRLIFDNPDIYKRVVVNEDRNRIMQVVTNFITNAIKFTSEGEIRYGFRIEGDQILVFVSDTGIGISSDKVDKVFDRFVKLNSFAQGTGLGLSICKMIVNMIGGEVNVTSELGKGSTFTFTIPYKQDRLRALEAEREATEGKMHTDGTVSYKTPTILVAEDVYSNYLLVKASIGKKYHLEWAKDGEEAVKMFKGLNPDLILMDIKMPNMDGYEATRLIRTYSRDVPIIAVTAFAFEADKLKAHEAGVTDYLAKPVVKASIEKIVKKYLGE